MNSPLKYRLLYSLFIAVTLFFVSAVGYRWLENFSWSEAIYMTIITLSTVGFEEVRPLTPAGRLFTAGIIVMGLIIIVLDSRYGLFCLDTFFGIVLVIGLPPFLLVANLAATLVKAVQAA